jgi:hypothetical protein
MNEPSIDALTKYIGRTGTVHLLGQSFNVRIVAIKRQCSRIKLQVESSKLPKGSVWVLQENFELDTTERTN